MDQVEPRGQPRETPVDEILARGRARRRRLRQGWAGGSGLVALAIIAAVVVLSRSPATQVHVTGGPTPPTAPQPTPELSPGAGSPLPTCRPDQYQLGIGVTGETSAGLGIIAHPTLVKGSPCTLTAQAQLSLVDSAGRPLAVAGNPSTATISGRVGAGADATMDFRNQFFWSNWCGVRSPEATLQVHLVEQGVSVTRTFSYPVCISQGQGSSLTLIPPASPGASSPNAITAATQREVAIYSALVRYEIGQLTATAQSPPDSMFFVQNQLFALAPTATATDPNRFTSLSQQGPVPAAVQEGITSAVAPTPLRFVPDPRAVSLPCATTKQNYVFRLGLVPPAGDQIQVYAGYVFTGAGGGGHEAVYALADTGTTWTVTGPVGIEQNTLGLCG
jgi:hypothetical protein